MLTPSDDERQGTELTLESYVWDVVTNRARNNLATLKGDATEEDVLEAVGHFGHIGGVILVGVDDEARPSGELPRKGELSTEVFSNLAIQSRLPLAEWGVMTWRDAAVAYALVQSKSWLADEETLRAPDQLGLDRGQALRLTRSRPPGLAILGDRRVAYRAALHQFEELLNAARAAEAASRPLLLYYAVSQAGLAIMAALAVEMDYAPQHGLWASRDDRTLLERTIEPRNHGVFPAMCAALGTDHLATATTVGAVWRSLPELARHPLHRVDAPPALRVWAYREDDFGGFSKLPMDRVAAVVPLHNVGNHADIARALSPYPSTRGWKALGAGAGLQQAETPDGWGIVLYWPVELGDVHGAAARLDEVAPVYRDRGRWLHPVVGGMRRTLPPFLRWWLVLFALSNYCRYEPVFWARALDIDHSQEAGLLEVLFEEAITAIPELVHELLASPLTRLDDRGQMKLF